MAPSSLSTFSISMAPSFLYFSPHQANPFPSLTRKPTFARLPVRPQTIAFASKPLTPSQSLDETHNQNQTQELNSPQPDKKSFAISTGELFLGIASWLIKSRNSRYVTGTGSKTGFLGDGPNGARVSGGERGAGYDGGERNGVVVEDKIEPDVLWEQRIKDVEAEVEQKRRVVTSPRFNFSAAGLSFPCHLGVAQFLIQKQRSNSLSQFRTIPVPVQNHRTVQRASSTWLMGRFWSTSGSKPARDHL